MVDKAEVRKAVKEHLHPMLRWTVFLEVRRLPTVLAPGEKIIAVAQGLYEARPPQSLQEQPRGRRRGRGHRDPAHKKPSHVALVVATDRRVMFLNAKFLAKRGDFESFNYARIDSVQCGKGLISGSVHVHSGGNNAYIRRVVPPGAARKFANAAGAELDNFGHDVGRRASAAPPDAAAANGGPRAADGDESPSDRLKRINALLKDDLITLEEAVAQRNKVMEEL